MNKNKFKKLEILQKMKNYINNNMKINQVF